MRNLCTTSKRQCEIYALPLDGSVKSSKECAKPGNSVTFSLMSYGRGLVMMKALLSSPSPFTITAIHDDLKDIPVSSLMIQGNPQWDKDIIKDVFNERDANAILNISLSMRRTDDIWFWQWEKRGEYSI